MRKIIIKKKDYNPEFIKEIEEIKEDEPIRIHSYDDLFEEDDWIHFDSLDKLDIYLEDKPIKEADTINETLHTKFGTAKIHKGYYQITSRKEGNHSKRLHRLIFEDFYNCEIPEGFVIHHKNGVKTDNCILNLQLMRDSEHKFLHNKGKKHTIESKQKMSKAHKGKHLSEETKRKLSESHKGKKLSDETKQKLSEANKGENNPMFGKKHTTESRKKMSDTKKGKYCGENNPNSQYTLWNIESVHYFKGNMFNNGREPNPCKCFQLKYNGKYIPIGGFNEFISPEIINDLINSILEEELK